MSFQTCVSNESHGPLLQVLRASEPLELHISYCRIGNNSGFNVAAINAVKTGTSIGEIRL